MILEKPYHPFAWKRLFQCLLATLLLLVAVSSSAQNDDRFGYEELSVTMHLPRVGNREIPAIIQGQNLFLSVTDVFDFLEINNKPSAYLDSISGFFLHPLSQYLVDRRNNYIIYEGVVYNLTQNSLLRTETGLYLRSSYFNEIFGLDCQFSFRALSVTLNTKLELPAIKRMQQETMRQNIRLLKKEIKADTTYRKSKQILNIAMADWQVNSSQESNGNTNTRANFNFGAYLLGGEANANIFYNNAVGFDARQSAYRWRYVNNKGKLAKQFVAGRIWTQATSTIIDPVNGIQITNTPTTYRKSFGTYRLTNQTEPDWTVELYVNNILINYTKADASGFFTFEVPLVYGNTVVTLRAYGPYGEERVKEEHINIPFNFVPVNQLEYSLSAGLVDDTLNSRFSRANINYGFSKRVTLGAGVEYLSSVDPGSVMPFINASARFGQRILFNLEHTANVRTKGFMSYRLPSNFQLELNYINYVKGQTAVRYNYLEERKATISYLIRTKPFTGMTKLSINQVKLPKMQQTQADWVISGMIKGISTNITTQAILATEAKPYVYSNLSLTFRLPAGIRLTPQVRYDFNKKEINSFRAEVEKRIFRHGFANVSYQTVPDQSGNVFSAGLRYNFNFAQMGASVRTSKQGTSYNQYASGSLLNDDKEKKLMTSYQGNVGRGGVVAVPFIDINCNGKRDKGEPKAAGLKLNVRGGKVERDAKDTVIRITGLEAHTDYLIECNKASFDNISWRICKPNIQVTVEPNHFKLVEVPVTVVGEVSGTVYLDKKANGGKAGIGRMWVNIYKNDTTLVAKALTEPDGYFSYLGLSPGKYTASIDTVQMAKLNFCCNDTHGFGITVSFEGDIVDGLDFNITSWDTIPPAPKVISTPAPVVDTLKEEKPKKDSVKDYRISFRVKELSVEEFNKARLGQRAEQPTTETKTGTRKTTEAPGVRYGKLDRKEEQPNRLGNRNNAATDDSTRFGTRGKAATDTKRLGERKPTTDNGRQTTGRRIQTTGKKRYGNRPQQDNSGKSYGKPTSGHRPPTTNEKRYGNRSQQDNSGKRYGSTGPQRTGDGRRTAPSLRRAPSQGGRGTKQSPSSLRGMKPAYRTGRQSPNIEQPAINDKRKQATEGLKNAGKAAPTGFDFFGSSRRTTDDGQRTTDGGVQTTDNGRRTTADGKPTTDDRRPTAPSLRGTKQSPNAEPPASSSTRRTPSEGGGGMKQSPNGGRSSTEEQNNAANEAAEKIRQAQKGFFHYFAPFSGSSKKDKKKGSNPPKPGANKSTSNDGNNDDGFVSGYSNNGNQEGANNGDKTNTGKTGSDGNSNTSRKGENNNKANSTGRSAGQNKTPNTGSANDGKNAAVKGNKQKSPAQSNEGTAYTNDVHSGRSGNAAQPGKRAILVKQNGKQNAANPNRGGQHEGDVNAGQRKTNRGVAGRSTNAGIDKRKTNNGANTAAATNNNGPGNDGSNLRNANNNNPGAGRNGAAQQQNGNRTNRNDELNNRATSGSKATGKASKTEAAKSQAADALKKLNNASSTYNKYFRAKQATQYAPASQKQGVQGGRIRGEMTENFEKGIYVTPKTKQQHVEQKSKQAKPAVSFIDRVKKFFF